MKNIVLGANAVWQKVVDLDHFTKGKVLRANSVIAMASGKGANVAIAMERLRGKEQLGIENHLLLQTLGGLTGSAIETDLEPFPKPHVVAPPCVNTVEASRSSLNLLRAYVPQNG
jgi:fructose-1-phosphate kinase PfkB-like protein